MRQCPSCNNWTLDFDDYFGRFRCFNPECAWMAPTSVEREIRLLRACNRPVVVNTTPIPELDITITTFYDEVNDALLFDFNKSEPSFEFPEEDGRMLWSIGRITGEVTGFTILGARRLKVTEIRLDFTTRKEAIERNIKSQPSALEVGRPTKALIESISVTMNSQSFESRDDLVGLSGAVKSAIDKFNSEYA